MTEIYPDDQALLALTHDADTGVPYIPTGLSPYYIAFRRMLHRLLRAAERANDLRVYADNAMSVGVRPGRCMIASQPVAFSGATNLAVPPNATTWLWLDMSGEIQQGEAFPGNRSTFLPLAKIATNDDAITALTDHRGEAFLHVTDTGSLGIHASAAQINGVLDGLATSVDADALNRLTGGALSTADIEHRHLRVDQYVDGQAAFTIHNGSTHADANVGLLFSVPQHLSGPIALVADTHAGALTQRHGTTSLHLLGMTHLAFNHEGDLTASQSDRLIGVVPLEGVLHAVILSVGANLISDTATDRIAATVKVNGAVVTVADAALSSAAGPGHRSTAQGDGTAAIVATNGSEQVARGDLLTVDLTRTAAGAVSREARDVTVLVIVRAGRPI